METWNLKNGSSEAKVLVMTTMIAIDATGDEGLAGAILRYELGELALNPNRECWGQTKADLISRLVMENGRMHDSIRNIVLSCIGGVNDIDTAWGSPLSSDNA